MWPYISLLLSILTYMYKCINIYIYIWYIHIHPHIISLQHLYLHPFILSRVPIWGAGPSALLWGGVDKELQRHWWIELESRTFICKWYCYVDIRGRLFEFFQRLWLSWWSWFPTDIWFLCFFSTIIIFPFSKKCPNEKKVISKDLPCSPRHLPGSLWRRHRHVPCDEATLLGLRIGRL